MSERSKQFLSIFITLCVIGASIYFFEKHSFTIAVILLVVGLYFIMRLDVREIAEYITHFDLERRCNVELQFEVDVEKVLKHPSLEPLYRKLRDNEALSVVTHEHWVSTMVQNYKNKFKKNYEVTFNLKNNLVWTNGKVDFRDSIFYSVYIPYNPNVDDDDIDSLFITQVEHALEIRLFVVNGIVKLQVGRFPKEYSPEILKGDGPAVYRAFETITSFPLMYFREHSIPVKYLNFTSYATKSKALYDTGNREKWLFDDWRQLVRETKDYTFLYTELQGDPSHLRVRSNRWYKIVERFELKRDEMLKREGFKGEMSDSEWARYLRKCAIHYSNQYLSIYVKNIELDKERFEEHVLPDFDEDPLKY